MSAHVDRLSGSDGLFPDERVRPVEIVLDSLKGEWAARIRRGEEARLGELWDEGIASGPGEALDDGEIIALVKSGLPSAERDRESAFAGFGSG